MGELLRTALLVTGMLPMLAHSARVSPCQSDFICRGPDFGRHGHDVCPVDGVRPRHSGPPGVKSIQYVGFLSL